MGLDSDARRRGLIEYLSLNGYATMRQLAGEFDVSIKILHIWPDTIHWRPHTGGMAAECILNRTGSPTGSI